MVLFKNLFTTDYGLMSLGVIAFVVVMGIWISRWLGRRMDEDERSTRR